MSRRREPVIVFDRICNLCTAVVRWIIAHDPLATFRFGPLQSEVARDELAKSRSELDVAVLTGGFVLIDDDGVHRQSTDTLRVAGPLQFPCALQAVGLLMPRSVRDAVYRGVVRRRYRWFGRRDNCL